MSAWIDREIELPAELIADGQSYPLKSLSVTFRDQAELGVDDMRLYTHSDSPIPATSKTLLLALPGRGILLTVLAEECAAKLSPPGEHLHLTVPDQSHRGIIASLVRSGEARQA